MTIPLHGKRSYVRIKRATLLGRAEAADSGEVDENNEPIIIPEHDINWNVVSFATSFAFDLEQQNIARAIVMGTDGILDIESHGLLAVANIDLILTDAQSVIIGAFGNVKVNPVNEDGTPDITLDYNSKINAAIGTDPSYFDGAVKIDIQVMPLTAYEDMKGDSILDATQSGFVFTIEDATLRSLRVRGAAGQYVTSTLSVEGGRLRVSQKKVITT